MKSILIITFTLLYTISFSQTSDSLRVDTTFNYEIKIPSWLRLLKTESPNLFGGTLPAVKGIENAIVIESFQKSAFKSFDEFKFIFLTGNTFGKPTKFDNEQIWYGQNELLEIPNGVKQKIFIYWQNKIYHNQFVLLQSKTAYLLIKFVATPETYDINIFRFNEFLSGLKVEN